ncbi:hypothetical protein TKK_0019567 [Trichogramma kaykai]|uniref:Uncharacterized protein n=1 Tax=Trichogramma kaykai TaxID=54128 RepID=A0ABD2VS04_9HYME
MTNNYSVRFIIIGILIFNFAKRLHGLPFKEVVESNKTKVQQDKKNTSGKIIKNLEYIIPYTNIEISGINEDFQAQSLSKVREFLTQQISKMKRSPKSAGIYLKNDGTLISRDYYPQYIMSDDSEEKNQKEFIDSTEIQFECICDDDSTECQKCIQFENEKRLKTLNSRNLNLHNSAPGTKNKINLRQSRTQPMKINIPFTKNIMMKGNNNKGTDSQKYLFQPNEETVLQSHENDFSSINSPSHSYDKFKENIPLANYKNSKVHDNIKLIAPNKLSKHKVYENPTFRTNQGSKPVNPRSTITGSASQVNSEEDEDQFDLQAFICSIINCLAYGNKFNSNSKLNKNAAVDKKIPIKKPATSIDCSTTTKAPTIDAAEQPKSGLISPEKNKTNYKSRYLVDIKPLTLDDIEKYNLSESEIKPEQPTKTVNNSNAELQNQNNNTSSNETIQNEGERLNKIIAENTIKKIINNLVPGKAQDLLVNYANEENLPEIVNTTEELLPEIKNVPVLKNLFAVPEVENMILDAANGLIGQLLDRPVTNEMQNLIKNTLHDIVESIPFRTDVESPQRKKFKKSVWNDEVDGFHGNSTDENTPPREVFDMLTEILNKSELGVSSVAQPIAQNLIVKATKYALDKKRGVIDESTIIQAYNLLVKPKYQLNSQFKNDPNDFSPNSSYVGAPKPLDQKITQPKNPSNPDNVQTNWPESIFSDNNEDDKTIPLTPIKENVLTQNGSSYTVEKALQNEYQEYDEDKKKALVERIKLLTKDQVTAPTDKNSTTDIGFNEQLKKDILDRFEEQHPLDNDSTDPKKQPNLTAKEGPDINQEKKTSILNKLKKINPQTVEDKVPGINDVLKKAIVKNLDELLNVTTIKPETQNSGNRSEIDFENSKIVAPTEMEIIPAASMNEPIKYYSNEGVLANYQKLHPPADVPVKQSIDKDFAGESSQLSRMTVDPESELDEIKTDSLEIDRKNISARAKLPSYMGKLVPVDKNKSLKIAQGSKLEFIGDGVRLPLTVRHMSDGTFTLILNDDLINADTNIDVSLKLKRQINSIAPVNTTRRPHERLKNRKKRAYTEADWERSQEEIKDSSIEEIQSNQIPKPDVDFVIRKMKKLLQSLLSMTKKSSARAEPIIKLEKYRSNDRKDYYRSVNSNDDTIVIVKSPSFPIKVAYDKPKVNLFQKLREKRRQVNHVPSQRFIKPTLSYQLSNPFKLFNSIEKWKHPNGYTKDNYMYQKIAKDDPIVGTKTEVVQDVLQLVKNLAINVPKKINHSTT